MSASRRSGKAPPARPPWLVPERFVGGPSRWGRSAGLLVGFFPPGLPAAARTASRLSAMFPDSRGHRAYRRGDAAGLIVAVGDLFLRTVALSSGESGVAGRSRAGARLFLAAARPDAALVLAAGLERLARRASREEPTSEPAYRATDLLAELVQVRDGQREAARLYEAARALGVPAAWPAWSGGCLVLGEGSARRLFHKAIFDGDAALTGIANDKLATAALLERAGVPTTRPVAVRSAAEAAALADEIGYPVVIKPALAWAQVGVWTGLRSRDEVRHAYERAQAQAGLLLGPLILERQKAGRYLRLTLVGGSVAGAYTCGRPAVTADGRKTAGELARSFYGLPLDAKLDERSAAILEAVLSAQGLTEADVPPARRRVQVGLSSQGQPKVETGELSTDVLSIVRSVAALFPLPVLAIDLLVTDTRRAARGKAVVVELNPSPSFVEHDRADGPPRTDLSRAIVGHLFPKPRSSSVPVLAVTPGASARLAGIAAALATRSVRAAAYSGGRSWLGEPTRAIGAGPASAALLTLDARAQAILFEVDRALLVELGLPTSHVDGWLSGRDSEGEAGRLLASICGSRPWNASSDADVAARLVKGAALRLS